jgi:uridine kinase
VNDLKTLLRNPLFLIGLALRLAMIATLAPPAAAHWYAPFVAHSIEHPSLDPWRSFLEAGGAPLAFPYGYAMWLVLLPFGILGHLAGADPLWGYYLTLLACDVGLLVVLRSLFNASWRKLLPLYWLSPVVLFATYWLGLNDVVPVLLLCIGLQQLRSLQMTSAGALCGAAVSAKLSMVLALPLIAIYLWRNRALQQLLGQFALGFGVAVVVLGLPFLLSAPAMQMLAGNPEMAKAYDLAISVGANRKIYVLPMAYLLATFLAWRMRRISFDLFAAMIGIVFLLVLLLTPAAPGWFLWVLPFLVVYQIQSGKVGIGLVALFSVLHVVLTLLDSSSALLPVDGAPGAAVTTFVQGLTGPHGASLLHTGMLGLGIVLVMTIYRYSVLVNDYYRISRRPIVIGIAGDSGAGKDTLVHSLTELFGSHSVTTVSGDDYHLWDRHKPMWQVMTHLNPRANNIAQFSYDVVSLKDGKSIQARHYDHGSGRQSRPLRVESNDVIVASGLHALYTPALRECYDLSIFLDIDEGLRRHFKLTRDVTDRGHTVEKVLSSLDKRDADSKLFIRPQAAHADLALSLQPIHPRILDGPLNKRPLRLKLNVRSRHSGYEERLVRVLVGVCGLHVDMQLSGSGNPVEMTIEGECSPEDVAMAARYLMPHFDDLLDIAPKWEGGVKGLMQIVVLSHLDQALRKRLI